MFEFDSVRRVIKGRTYDTDTAKRIAENRYEDDEGKVIEVLFRTKGGAFFLLVFNNPGRQAFATPSRVDALSKKEAYEWLGDANEAEIFDDEVRSSFEEATESDTSEVRTVTFTLRLPEPLRDRLQRAASEQGVSINAYLIQCSQRCLKDN